MLFCQFLEIFILDDFEALGPLLIVLVLQSLIFLLFRIVNNFCFLVILVFQIGQLFDKLDVFACTWHFRGLHFFDFLPERHYIPSVGYFAQISLSVSSH